MQDSASARLYKTFLFTDIVASTAIRAACVRKFGDRGNELFEREVTVPHDDLVSGLVARHHGEVVSTAGDSFFAAFSYARDAVECAIAIQRALKGTVRTPIADAGLPQHITLRIGLHSGTARQVLRAGQPNYEDHAINIAARIAALAGSEQILISNETWQQAGEHDDVRERSWPGQALKGVAGEWTLVEILWDERGPRGIGDAATPSASTASRPPRFGRRAAVAAAAVVVLAGTLGIAWKAFSKEPPPAVVSAADVRVRKSVAVLGFKNLTARADRAWLSTALAEMFGSELAAGGALRMVAGESVARMRADLDLVDADAYTPETLARIRRHTGADIILLGSYVSVGGGDAGQMRLDLRLQDAAKGDTVATVTETGGDADLLAIVTRAGQALRTHLGVATLSAASEPSIRSSFPANVSAVRDYTEALKRLRMHDASGARGLLERVIRIEPSYPHAHASLSAAWAELGYDAEARKEATRALDLAQALPDRERLSIEAQYRGVVGDWKRAAAIHREAWEEAPDNTDFGLNVVSALRAAGQIDEAKSALDRLRALPPPASDDPRIDLAEAVILGDQGNQKGRLDAADRAVAKATERGARLIVAQAQTMRVGALVQLGRIDEAIATGRQAVELFFQAGNRNGGAMVKVQVGSAYYRRDDLDNAQKWYAEALDVFKAIGRKDALAGTLNNLGNVAQRQYRYADAEAFWKEAVATAREAGRVQDTASFLHNLGNYHSLFLGELAQADRYHREALAVHKGGGYRRHAAEGLLALALTATRRGDVGAAQGLVDEVVPVCSDLALPDLTARCHRQRGHVLRLRDQPRKSVTVYQEAVRLQEERRAEAHEELQGLAWAALDAGNVDEASASAQKAIQALETRRRPTHQALKVLAAAALERKDAASLVTLSERLGASGAGELNFPDRAARDLVAAIVTASTAPARGISALLALERECAAKGWLLLSYEARLAAASIQLRSGSSDAGRKAVETVAADARARGLSLVERKAAAIAAGSWNPFFW